VSRCGRQGQSAADRRSRCTGNYNGVQLSWLKQTGHLSFNVNYTYSKSLGIINSTIDAFNVAPNYGVLNIDRPHVINTSYAYTMGSPFKGNLTGRGAINGWTVSGITTWQAGGNLQALYQQNLGLTIQNTTLGHTIGSSTYYGTPSQSVLPILTCNPTSGLKNNQKVNMGWLLRAADRAAGYSSNPVPEWPCLLQQRSGGL
jgi:hypothetical protein